MKRNKPKQDNKNRSNKNTGLKHKIRINLPLPNLPPIRARPHILPNHPPNQPQPHHRITNKTNKKPPIPMPNTSPNPRTMI